MQKSKKQKHEQQIRKNLKTYLHLFSPSNPLISFLTKTTAQNQSQSLLQKTYPYINGVNLLRICTLIEINYIVTMVFDIIKKTKLISCEEVKIGIIGGGIMGRLIVNTLLIFTKDGLRPQNIMISSRQPHHLQFYTQNFHIQTFFDNNKIAEEADIIFVSTPGTLDNWILSDLNKNLQSTRLSRFFMDNQYNRNSYQSTLSLKMMSQKSKASSIDMISYEKSKISELNQNSNIKVIPSNNEKQSVISMNKNEKCVFYPLVYVLTSDFHEEKCQRIFKFPVLTPWVRAKDIQKIIQKMKQKINQFTQIESNVDNQKILKQLQQIMVEEIFSQKQTSGADQINKNNNNNNNNDDEQNKSKSRIDKLIIVFEFFAKKIQDQWKREQNININTNINNKSKLAPDNPQPQKKQLTIRELFQTQQNYGNTFLTKCRKWKMAYNNFIA